MPEIPSENPRLPFEIDEPIDPSLVTPHAGVPLVIKLFRRVWAAQVVNARVQTKQRQRGVTPAQEVETLIARWTVGGNRCQDLQTLRADVTLAALLGDELPAATTMRGFLEAFHAEEPPLLRAGKRAPSPGSRPPGGCGRCHPASPLSGAAASAPADDRHAGCGGDDPGGSQAAGDRGL